jgi:nucleotide-binding universal stress UspA family protein
MYRSILVAVDLSDEASAPKPLAAAVELGRAFGARLHAVAVVRDVDAMIGTQYFPPGYAWMLEEAERRLASLLRRECPEDLHVESVVTHGASIYGEILRVAAEMEADLIVMGPHRPELKDYLLGTNASRVVRHAACSVLIVRG